MKTRHLFLLLIILTTSQNLFSQDYSFFVAGHAYGNPNDTPYLGMYKPFVEEIPSLNADSSIKYGFFTGDIVREPAAANWDAVESELSTISSPTYIAAGNHDVGLEFENRFNYYQSFTFRNNLFVVLSPSISQWNIKDEQLDFLKTTLDSNYKKVDDIFIFIHELIWWSPTNKYSSVKINWTPHYPGSTNYDTIIKPLLESYPNQFTIYAGDVGASQAVSPCMYAQENNITLIATGMGSATKDNYIITTIKENGDVDHELVSFNSPVRDYLGSIYNYDLELGIFDGKVITPGIYPNPTSNSLTLHNPLNASFDVILHNNNGQSNFITSIAPEANHELSLELSQGHYILEFFNGSTRFTKVLYIVK